jgi:biopolymer transport protein ExbD
MEGDDNPLDLAPFMNMVVILIPMLLLSVVFIKIGIINITAPDLSTGPKTEKKKKDEEKPLNLTVTVSTDGLTIATENKPHDPIGDCPKDGPTLCTGGEIDVAQKFDRAAKQLRQGNIDQGQKTMYEGLSAYKWRQLYNELTKIKSKNQDENVINVSAESDIPFAAVVQVMDHARYMLEEDSYSSSQKFTQAQYRKKTTGGKGGQIKYAKLFPNPVLAITKQQ